MSQNTYDSDFFRERSGEIRIAKEILGHVFEYFKPESVVDLGTATGSWLLAAKQMGVARVNGIDGPWVPAEQRLISEAEFVLGDLEDSIPDLGHFDLAICTEVLEHISAPASVRAVEWLCRSAPVVLFSAAIPSQGGTHHINEAWQSHWSALFKQQGYEPFDLIRPKIWSDSSLPFWYRQNILIMANDQAAEKLGLGSPSTMLDCVHPDLYLDRLRMIDGLRRRTFKAKFRSFMRRLTRSPRE